MKNRIGKWNGIDVYQVDNLDAARRDDEVIYVFDNYIYYKYHKIGRLRGNEVLYDFDYDQFYILKNWQPPAAPTSKMKEETSSTSGENEENSILRVPSVEELDEFFKSISVKLEDYV